MMKATIALLALLLCGCGGLQTVQWPAHEPVTVHSKPPENPKLPLPRQDSFGEAEVGFRIEYQAGGLMSTPGHVVRNTQYRHSPWVNEPLDIDLLIHLDLAPGAPLPDLELLREYEPAEDHPGLRRWVVDRTEHTFDYLGPEPQENVSTGTRFENALSRATVKLYREQSAVRAVAFEDGSRRLTLRFRWRLDPAAENWKAHTTRLSFRFADGYQVVWPLFR